MSTHRQTDDPEHSGIEHLARGLVVRSGAEGPVVLLCRARRGGYTYLPGGHVEFGESASDALRREMREETGIHCRAGACLLVMEEHFEQRGCQKHEYTVVFHVEHLQGEDEHLPPTARPPITIESREDWITFEWVAIDRLSGADLRPARLIDWIRSESTARETWLPAN